jgi:predicted RNA-binding Zn ribbon-like protein
MESPALDFLNSERSIAGRDLLDDRAWRHELLRSVGCGERSASPQRLKELRALLREVAQTLSRDAVPSSEQLEAVNAVLRTAPVRPHLFHDGSRYGLELTPLRRDERAVLAELTGHFARLVLRLQPPRLKLCPGCGRAFYDESRNRSRRWCESQTCGNRIRVRRFREKRRTRS